MGLLIGIIAYILIGVLFYFVRLYWLYLNGNEHINCCSFRYWFYNIHDFKLYEIVYAILWPIPFILVLIIYIIGFICYLIRELK